MLQTETEKPVRSAAYSKYLKLLAGSDAPKLEIVNPFATQNYAPQVSRKKNRVRPRSESSSSDDDERKRKLQRGEVDIRFLAGYYFFLCYCLYLKLLAGSDALLFVAAMSANCEFDGIPPRVATDAIYTV